VKRIAVASLLLVALVACGREEPKLAEPDTASTSIPAATLETTPTTTAQSTTSTVKDAMTTSKNGGGDPYGAMTPPDGVTPAAGSCSQATGGVAAITLNPDVPSPRCIVVHDTDRLKVTNNMGVKVHVDDGYNGYSQDIDNGATQEEVKAVGCCWQPGVHRLRVSNANTHAQLYGGSGPEVWLQS
jgi:hypothetical protein